MFSTKIDKKTFKMFCVSNTLKASRAFAVCETERKTARQGQDMQHVECIPNAVASLTRPNVYHNDSTTQGRTLRVSFFRT